MKPSKQGKEGEQASMQGRKSKKLSRGTDGIVTFFCDKDGVTRLQSPVSPGMDANGTTHVIALML